MKFLIGIGSNLGNKEQNIEKSINYLSEFSILLKKSSVYETEPVGKEDQASFLNQVIEISTDLTPLELIFKTQEIEHKMGRKRLEKNSPRTIDLDILFAEQNIINQTNIQIPHPRVHQRGFTLIPLAEIWPNFNHPTLQKSIIDLKKQLKSPKSVVLWKTTLDKSSS